MSHALKHVKLHVKKKARKNRNDNRYLLLMPDVKTNECKILLCVCCSLLSKLVGLG